MVVGECNTFANKDLVEQYRVQYVFDVEDSFKEKQTYIIAIGTNILMNIISQYVHEQPGKEQWKLWTLTSDFRRSQDDSRALSSASEGWSSYRACSTIYTGNPNRLQNVDRKRRKCRHKSYRSSPTEVTTSTSVVYLSSYRRSYYALSPDFVRYKHIDLSVE